MQLRMPQLTTLLVVLGVIIISVVVAAPSGTTCYVIDGQRSVSVFMQGATSVDLNTLRFGTSLSARDATAAIQQLGTYDTSECWFQSHVIRDPTTVIVGIPFSEVGRIWPWANSYVQPEFLVVEYKLVGGDYGHKRKAFRIPSGRASSMAIDLP